MATPPPLKGFIIDWLPPPKPDAAHVYVADRTREKVVEVEGELNLLIPIVKQYTDPYDLQKLQPKEYKVTPPCPLCFKISVSKLMTTSFQRQPVMNVLPSPCVNPDILRSYSVSMVPNAWRTSPPSSTRGRKN